MLTIAQIAELKALQSQGFSGRAISQLKGYSNSTVHKYLKVELNTFSSHYRIGRTSKYRGLVHEAFLRSAPTMSTVFSDIHASGIKVASTTVKKYCREILRWHYSFIPSHDKKPRKRNRTNIVIKRQEWFRLFLSNRKELEPEVTRLLACYAEEEAQRLKTALNSTSLRLKKRAVAILAHLQGYSIRETAIELGIGRYLVTNCIKMLFQKGVTAALNRCSLRPSIYSDPKLKEDIFAILHCPPSNYGFNRTSWRHEDLRSVLKQKEFPCNKKRITRIIRESGFSFRKAKKVLTSPDPLYEEKLKQITSILSNLGQADRFFSIDEFGPFSVKMRGGNALVDFDVYRAIPQYQKSKGRIIVTAALELSTNQVTHFYSDKKNTDEMLKLLWVLLEQYKDCRTLYLSWDAASWHISKKLNKEVESINNKAGFAKVKLAPLPASAQFLNVIESVFSGMARAIIHNSDYESVETCKTAIDRYYKDRNSHFQMNPKRAGDKIWGKERVIPQFSPANNCKDPNYR